MRCFEGLTSDERRALTLAFAYEKRRRETQYGYRLWGRNEKVDDFVKKPTFRQFVTVTRWLASGGWNITWKEIHWQGYVHFVFDSLTPNIPMPGQLKNRKLLREYLASAPREQTLHERTPQEMDERYQRVLIPEFRGTRARAALGLRKHTG